eukprot:8078815-Lingulodinium_polyedra.AAC.1
MPKGQGATCNSQAAPGGPDPLRVPGPPPATAPPGLRPGAKHPTGRPRPSLTLDFHVTRLLGTPRLACAPGVASREWG